MLSPSANADHGEANEIESHRLSRQLGAMPSGSIPPHFAAICFHRTGPAISSAPLVWPVLSSTPRVGSSCSERLRQTRSLVRSRSPKPSWISGSPSCHPRACDNGDRRREGKAGRPCRRRPRVDRWTVATAGEDRRFGDGAPSGGPTVAYDCHLRRSTGAFDRMNRAGTLIRRRCRQERS